MNNLVENGWDQGWIPSSAERSNIFDFSSKGLLRMDNLELNEKGILRLIRGPKAESVTTFTSPRSIYGTPYILTPGDDPVKLRYVYTADGTLKRNYGTGNAQDIFDKTLITGATSKRCAFLTAMNRVLCIAGDQKYVDLGSSAGSLEMITPNKPYVERNATISIDATNWSGSGNGYANWSSVDSTYFDNTSQASHLYWRVNPATKMGDVHTTFSSPQDFTNLDGTGNDTPDDLFYFQFYSQYPSGLQWVRLRFYMENGDFYEKVWYASDIPDPSAWFRLQCTRKDFNRSGTNPADTWANVVSVQVGTCNLNSTDLSRSNDLFDGVHIEGGLHSLLTGTFSYKAVAVNNQNNIYQFSKASEAYQGEPIVMASYNVFLDLNTNLDPLANEIWIFRLDPAQGEYLFDQKVMVSEWVNDTPYPDYALTSDLEEAAIINNYYNLEQYRENLPDNIIGMIWFADRVIYLTETSFIPSFKYDPGTYDSRFVYELNGSSAEQCLFIAKLDVGTIIIATTKDFYRVTGSFAKLSDGMLDVNIYPLGISDPAISTQFAEVGGSLIYFSATGFRMLSNGSTTLLNGELDLLWRGENRYSVDAIDYSTETKMAVATSGERFYFTIDDRMFVARGGLWRYEPTAYNVLFREEDGTILAAKTTGTLLSLEQATVSLPIDFRTQYNYARTPNNRKDACSVILGINTGGVALTLTVKGMDEAGSVTTFTTTVNSAIPVNIDIKGTIGPSVAFSFEITGTTNSFYLDYINLVYEPRPIATKRAIVFATNFGKPNKKKLATWPILVDPRSGNITLKVKADGVSQTDQVVTASDIRTLYWRNATDFAAIDWELELVSNTPFELFKVLPPEILQVFPMGKYIDQVGPIDFNYKGLLYGIRLRVLNEGTTLNYKIYDADAEVLDEDLTTLVNQDQTYIIPFPKGIDPSICRVVLSAATLFYRFSLEFKIRETGKETEQKYIKIKDANSSN